MNIKIFHRTIETISQGKAVRRVILTFYNRNQDLFEKAGKMYYINQYKGHSLKGLFHSMWPVIAIPLREKPKKVDQHITSATSINETDYRETKTMTGISVIRRNSEVPIKTMSGEQQGYVVVFLHQGKGTNTVNFYATAAENNQRRSYTLILTNEMKKANVSAEKLDRDIPICPKCGKRPDYWLLNPHFPPGEGYGYFMLFSNVMMGQGISRDKLMVENPAIGSPITLEDICSVVCETSGHLPHVFTSGDFLFNTVLEQARNLNRARPVFDKLLQQTEKIDKLAKASVRKVGPVKSIPVCPTCGKSPSLWTLRTVVPPDHTGGRFLLVSDTWKGTKNSDGLVIVKNRTGENTVLEHIVCVVCNQYNSKISSPHIFKLGHPVFEEVLHQVKAIVNERKRRTA